MKTNRHLAEITLEESDLVRAFRQWKRIRRRMEVKPELFLWKSPLLEGNTNTEDKVVPPQGKEA